MVNTIQNAAKISLYLIISCSIASFLFAYSAHAAENCHQFTSSTKLPSGFAVPYDTQSSTKDLLMNITCNDTANVTVGNGGEFEFIYEVGHAWNGSSWERFIYTGANKTGDWYRNTAKKSLPKRADGEKYYVLAYMCQYVDSKWKCGCKDSSCASRGWMIQAYSQEGSAQAPSTSSGGGSFNDDRGSAPPPAGGFDDINILPPNATLPSVEECKARVHKSTWEPRSQNSDENYNTSDLILPDNEGVDGIAPDRKGFYNDRIKAVNDANITGTTDELIQFFSCYWGVDDEQTRARAAVESSWDQDVNGDVVCNGKGVSWGLLQIQNKTPRGCSPAVHDYAYPDVFVSTGNNLNYALAWTAACYRGDMYTWVPGDHMGDPNRRMRECVGMWFSGMWQQGNSAYLSKYDELFNRKPWLSSVGFVDQNVENVCRDEWCDNLPQDY